MIKKIALIACAAIAATVFSSVTFAEEPQVEAIREVAPVYPTSALQRRHTGWAVVHYSVDENGRATDIQVIDSEPSQVFDRAARRAISQSRFEVTEVDGQAVTVSDQYKKFVFELEEDVPGDLASRRRW